MLNICSQYLQKHDVPETILRTVMNFCEKMNAKGNP